MVADFVKKYVVLTKYYYKLYAICSENRSSSIELY